MLNQLFTRRLILSSCNLHLISCFSSTPVLYNRNNAISYKIVFTDNCVGRFASKCLNSPIPRMVDKSAKWSAKFKSYAVCTCKKETLTNPKRLVVKSQRLGKKYYFINGFLMNLSFCIANY